MEHNLLLTSKISSPLCQFLPLDVSAKLISDPLLFPSNASPVVPLLAETKQDCPI